MESKNSQKTIRTTIYLPKGLHSELRIEAIKQDTSMKKLVIRAIENELKSVMKDRPD